jgi:hypothetical protein
MNCRWEDKYASVDPTAVLSVTLKRRFVGDSKDDDRDDNKARRSSILRSRVGRKNGCGKWEKGTCLHERLHFV